MPPVVIDSLGPTPSTPSLHVHPAGTKWLLNERYQNLVTSFKMGFNGELVSIEFYLDVFTYQSNLYTLFGLFPLASFVLFPLCLFLKRPNDAERGPMGQREAQ